MVHRGAEKSEVENLSYSVASSLTRVDHFVCRLCVFVENSHSLIHAQRETCSVRLAAAWSTENSSQSGDEQSVVKPYIDRRFALTTMGKLTALPRPPSLWRRV